MCKVEQAHGEGMLMDSVRGSAGSGTVYEVVQAHGECARWSKLRDSVWGSADSWTVWEVEQAQGQCARYNRFMDSVRGRAG